MSKMKKPKKPNSSTTARAKAQVKTRSPAAPLRGRFQELVARYSLAAVAGAIVIGVVAAVVMWAGGYVGILAERTETAMRAGAVDAGFEVQRVTVMGRRQAGRREVETAIGPAVGESILHFDLGEARRRVENLGWVRSASVSRLLPNTIHVSIRERAPAAVWQLSGALHLIDEVGAVIRSVEADEYAELPLIVGAGAPEAAAGILTALNLRPELSKSTAALTRVGDRRWNLRLRNGLDVMLPEAGYEDALGVLAQLQEGHGTLDQPLEYIDLRDPERLVTRKRDGSADLVAD